MCKIDAEGFETQRKAKNNKIKGNKNVKVRHRL